MDFYRDDWSPRSVTSASSSSPPSTPTRPPYFELNSEMDDLKDDVYSPVYSDMECDNDEGTSLLIFYQYIIGFILLHMI